MFDLVILGGGPAGYAGAIRAAKLGLSVALVEKGDIGGTCLNRGCIPTKCLLRSSELYRSREEWESLGVRASDVTFDEEGAYDNMRRVVASLRGGVESLVKAGGITLVRGEGKILGVGRVEAGGEVIECRNILVATGSRPAVLPVEGGAEAMTSDDALAAPVTGGRIAIVGGGVIGCELADYFSGTGREVTLIEYADRILPPFGKELSSQLAAVFRKRKIDVVTGARVTALGKDFVEYERAGASVRKDCDAVVVAVGRVPVTDGIGLENIGLKAGRIAVDGNFRTAVKGVYAAGDAAEGVQLAHYATAGALRAVDDIAGRAARTDMSVVPSVVYTHPEVAAVGCTDDGLRTGKFMLGANGKSLINGSNRGFIKVFCDDKGTLCGAELFGAGVSELIGELALAIERDIKAEEVAAVIHAHPTLYESVAEACEDVDGLATHKR